VIKIWLKKSIRIGDRSKLLDIKLRINKGEFIAVFGKSGEGKTTLLRMIAGLTKADYGYIKVDNEIWFNSRLGINLPPQKRNVGFVFQDYALFPNMTVEDNIKFGMERKDDEFLNKLLELTELTELRKHKPNKLSGGQKQRVALARAVGRKPKILLLDEPFSALDYQTKGKIYEEILKLHKEFNLTIVLVSHNIEEIVNLADKVFIIKDGKIDGSFITPSDLVNKVEGEILDIEEKNDKVLLTVELKKEDLKKLKGKKIKIYQS